jgi:hypothetical protein
VEAIVSNAVSAHGTLVYRNGVLIPELTDVRPPELSRETVETTRLGDDDDVHKTSIRSTSRLVFTINLLFDDAQHIALLDAWETTVVDDWEVRFADGAVWAFQGWVCAFGPASPVDGIQSAEVQACVTDGLIFGDNLAQEDGDALLLEDGGYILL